MNKASEEFADQLLITLDNLGHLIAMAEQHAKEYAQKGLDEQAALIREDFSLIRAEIQRMYGRLNTHQSRILAVEQKMKDLLGDWNNYQRHLLNERNANGASV